MPTLPKLTVDGVRGRATEKVYARGLSYYNEGAIFNTVRRGNELEGFCEGSNPTPYHIQVSFDSKGVTTTACTCEYDWGGDCKHIVALLLTYVHKPEAFEERAPIQDVLAERSKDDLIALIHEMVDRYPELSHVIDRPVPGSHSRSTALNTESFRRELRYAFDGYEGWGDRTPDFAVSSIARTAIQFAAQGDWRSASAIYGTILEECAAGEEYLFDDEGEFVTEVNDVLEAYVKCLEQPEIVNDEMERQSILFRLIDVELWDIKVGGIGIGDNIEIVEIVLNHAKPLDLPGIRAKLQAAKKSLRGGYSDWSTNAIEEILAELDLIDNVDPEQTLNRLRDEGHYRLVFDRLLKLKRVDEAVTIARDYLTEPSERWYVAAQLTAVGCQDTAIELARDAFDKKYDHALGGWLIEAYKRTGDKERYLELVRKQMLAMPSEQHYTELKAAAEALSHWQDLRPEILEWLRKERHFNVLVEIYLHDEEWDAAWKTLERDVPNSKSTPYSWLYQGLDLKVAQRSRQARPRRALPVYTKYARWEIGQRDRKHYQMAVEYLTIARGLYRELGEDAGWEKLISGIRDEFRTLRALQDELNKAKL